MVYLARIPVIKGEGWTILYKNATFHHGTYQYVKYPRPKFNSSPLNPNRKRNGLFSNHHFFSGVNALLNFGGVGKMSNSLIKPLWKPLVSLDKAGY